MFSKILIANRGEIAVRVIRACKEMGVSTVAVHSPCDRESLHVALADEHLCIGGNSVSESYLNMESILAAAEVTGAGAIHPGYGLLSENSQFAALCEKFQLPFIGPSSDIIRRMGNKEEARRTMQSAGVPVVPGTDVIEDLAAARKAAETIGFPLLCKARSGGGGRGIRLVERAEDFETAFLTASREAQSAFGDGGIYLEKYLARTKHIEIQLLCDKHGNAVSLGERDCSMQRRRQKMLEESPAPTLKPRVREAMVKAAVKAAEAVKYTGVGTIEFLLDGDDAFYFMEMNTRLQVEHPVTEFVTGIDLVKWQIRTAAGAVLPFKQSDIDCRGHAIECRIVAENPAQGFRPSCGVISRLHVPAGPWVRFDSHIYQNYQVLPYYDSLLGKLIVHASTREEALRKLRAALCELVITGVDHNGEFLMDLLAMREFIDGSYHTNTLEGLGN
ncbi:acetyl-CoA carboxylase, biotin carboxylase subunit [uncultured Eubacteriales bacterium]|uniref:biotin carboxylase n=1 Tax=uncultured Eubacteriales bacterium TaxID=172733 RepID=A0A212KAC2_9FIRM|nr:acetyl-CoA carboxylase, biotin carboxylase subunit [uncultured Eubacteriales bacterium]